MNIVQVTCGFTIENLPETKEFYENHLGAVTLVEGDGYLYLGLGDTTAVLEFRAPLSPEDKPSDTTGLGFNFLVDDVDLAYTEIDSAELEIAVPIEDHPWGERGFGIEDPNGLSIYIYSVIGEPTEEFKKQMEEGPTG